MGDRDDDDWMNHEVGFRRPPPWGQFQQGQSGNPKGRPRKKDQKATGTQLAQLTEFEQLVSELLGEEIMLTLGGSKVPVSKKRAILLNLFKQAMTGQPLAMRELNRIIEKVEAKEEARARAEAEAAEETARESSRQDEACFKHLVELKDKQTKAWAKAAAEGRDEPAKPWPHPDDILIDHVERKARVRGPLCADNIAGWEHIRRRRDHYLTRMVLASYPDEPWSPILTKVWLACLAEEDQLLPRRWQILHDLRPATDRLLAMRRSRLETIVAEGAAGFERIRPRAPQSKACYQRQNRVWAPLVKALGYRSLRHFERTFEDCGTPA